MNCGEFRERIDDYMDGLLDEALHARMDAHACECTQCAGLLKQAMEIKAALADLDDEAPVPAEVSAAWRRAVKLEAERRRRARVWLSLIHIYKRKINDRQKQLYHTNLRAGPVSFHMGQPISAYHYTGPLPNCP